jgi:PAS domain S-box-containing protein
VLGLTVAGFIVARALAERNARHDSERRVEIAAAQIQSRLDQATSLTESLRRFMLDQGVTGVTNDEFAGNAFRWLFPNELPAAAWAEEVRADRRSYLPATLVSGFPPLSVRGVDLRREPGIAAALRRAIRPGGVGATPLTARKGRTSGLFLVAPAPNFVDGVLRTGAVVVFVSEATLHLAARNAPGLRLLAGDSSSSEHAGGGTVREEVMVAGRQFAVVMPEESVSGPGALLPWLILAAGLVLAALAGALGVNAARRGKAQASFDRIFTLSPDLLVVAGFDGYYKRVNPAFGTLLGYTEEEALSRPYVEFVHPDDRERTDARRQELREGTARVSFQNRYICKDGSLRSIEWTAVPVFEERLTYAVGRDVTERQQTENDLRDAEERNRALAEEQAALRRVATLAARGVPPDELFAAVAEEAGQLLPVDTAAMGRYDADGLFTTVAAWSKESVAFPVGTRWVPEGRNVMTIVFETGRPARLDDFADASGAVGVTAREAGYRSAVGTPIIVDGRLWGVMTAASSAEQPLPKDIEGRLSSFTDLVATAIANTESRTGLARLAEEQVALRRVATLVAEGVRPAEVFSAVSEVVAGLFGSGAGVLRYEPDGAGIVFVGAASVDIPIGTRWEFQEGMASAEVYRTLRSARVDSMDWASAEGPVAEAARRLRIRSTVASPIVVEGVLWGAMSISSPDELLPPDSDERLEKFTELVATAIANAESRSELAASRRRIVAAADAERRRIERDLHDGIQQRLVSLGLDLRVAEATVPEELDEARTTISRVAGDLHHSIDELREISRGIHPAILSEGGLAPALRTLARRSAVPVELDAELAERLPEPIEVAAYYVISEALTNAIKHADASHVDIEAAADDGSLRLSIRDDGIGGADPERGSGLVGLTDRVEALGGTVRVNSRPGEGTQINAELPVDHEPAETRA